MTSTRMTYSSAGVDSDQADGGLGYLRKWVEQTFTLRKELGSVKLPLGYFANVIDVGKNLGIAFATDGVGTKILVAQRMEKLDTVGIDCVAMNVNDIICVGAEPLALVDYVALESAEPKMLGELAKGLHDGAKMANITIPGGEMAQVKEMIRGEHEGIGFDLVGSCIGVIPLDRIIYGENIDEGDIVVGLRSTGIHSNGLTLARHVFFEQSQWNHDHYVPELARTIGEELLEPTRIYVPEVMAMINAGLGIKAMAHITGDGLLNLNRVNSDASFVLDSFPEPHPIFNLIQSQSDVPIDEMFRVFNMGIGFCVVVAANDADAVHAIAKQHQVESHTLGVAKLDGKKEVRLTSHGLVGHGKQFTPVG